MNINEERERERVFEPREEESEYVKCQREQESPVEPMSRRKRPKYNCFLRNKLFSTGCQRQGVR
ncbi:MAG: hypothetical protein MJE68_12055 [Proteobacteria bacterium]|nr:hypothetical protein [Pseudomonadota bacterium]